MRLTEIEGLDELQRKLKDIPKGTEKEVGKELDDIRLDLEGEAKRRAPVKTGDLKGSGFSERDGLDVTVGFTEPYALRQHEELEYEHPKGGEAKYLENPFKERVNKYIRAVGEAVRKAVDKG